MNIGKMFDHAAHEVSHAVNQGIDQAKESMPKIDMQQIQKDVLQRFDSVTNLYDRFNEASQSLLADVPSAHFPEASAKLLKQMQDTVSDRRLQSWVSGAEGGMKQIGKEAGNAWSEVQGASRHAGKGM